MKKEILEKLNKEEWTRLESLLGISWAMFIALIGGREAGKSYAVTEWFIKQWLKHGTTFTWLRLTESSVTKLLQNNAAKLIDAKLRRKYKLKITKKNDQVYANGKLIARVLSLSGFHNDKGSALFDDGYHGKYHICLDEMNRELTEKNTFDILYAFTNQIENLIRSTKEGVKIFLIGNTLSEGSDILSTFNFEPVEFGRYKLKRKRCVIDYMPPTEKYLERRSGTAADYLMPTASTFTNKIETDRELITKKKRISPTQRIVFSNEISFTLWDNEIITKSGGEKPLAVIAMKPHLKWVYIPRLANTVIENYNFRNYKFDNIATYIWFKKYLKIYSKLK